jgi:hypothetical protein
VLAVGEQLWGQVPEVLLRVACPFAGGVGATHEEMCGVFAGAVILAGAGYGRVSAGEDDKLLKSAVAALRERFVALAGHVRCDDVRSAYPDVPKRCAPIVREGARLVMQWFDELPPAAAE